MSKQDFYSHGKLLLTGEYVVLDQGKALALPTKFGQSLQVSVATQNYSHWESYFYNGDLWHSFDFSMKDICTANFKAKNAFEARLQELFTFIYAAKPELFQYAYNFKTVLEFPQQWGLGSSSTLVNNLSQWAEINPYALLKNSFGGSGYDLAAAQCQTPFFYTRNALTPQVESASLPDFIKEHIFFIYLNQKQNSRDAIKHYKSRNHQLLEEKIKEVSQISEQIPKVENLEDFEDILRKHESILAGLLGQKKVQEKRFSDYTNGLVKSLGAWGGDFVLVTAREANQLSYFKEKGYETILPYKTMIL
ncbi:MAG: mevalonate kinase [Psychroflexus sp.]|nr:mevalonate kinase [Psychroflexus sp.]MDN6309832.1 mevalonate kinase [Psychroflexus sp.]